MAPGNPHSPRAELALAGVWGMLLVLVPSAGTPLSPAVPWHHPGQCRLLGGCLELLGEAGREGMWGGVRDWASSTVAKWRRRLSALPNPASLLCGVGAGARAPGSSVLHSTLAPREGMRLVGATTSATASSVSNATVAPACWHRPHRPLTARRGPCKVTAPVGPCKAPRQREYPAPIPAALPA